MAEQPQRVEVDIAAAVAALQASPELGAALNELVGGEMGKELNAAHGEIERLTGQVEYLRDGLRMIADAAKDAASLTWIESNAEALLRGEEFVKLS